MDKITYCVGADPRPTCVIDLDALDGPSISFQNSALQEQCHLLDEIVDNDVPGQIHAWALDERENGATGKDAIYAYTVDKRWRIVQWQGFERRSAKKGNGQLEFSEQATPEAAAALPTSDPQTLDRRLHDATGKLSNLLKMMEMVDVGMFEYNKEGVLVYGNDAFHSLTGVPKDDDGPMVWANWVFEEDKADLIGVWDSLISGTSCTFDMRWIGPAPDENPEGHWVTAACVPTTDDAGNVITISGCITDISAQKRSHMDAVKRAEALERAQASEKRFANFIKHSNVAFYNFNVDRKVRSIKR